MFARTTAQAKPGETAVVQALRRFSGAMGRSVESRYRTRGFSCSDCGVCPGRGAVPSMEPASSSAAAAAARLTFAPAIAIGGTARGWANYKGEWSCPDEETGSSRRARTLSGNGADQLSA